jgi:signal transduction histidine kinase
MTPEPLSTPVGRPRSLKERLTRHFVALFVTFGVAGSLSILLAFGLFAPHLRHLHDDWMAREQGAIRSVGGLEAATVTPQLLGFLDLCAEQQLALWTELKKHPELAYVRVFSTANAEIATVYADGVNFRNLPAPLRFEWDRSSQPSGPAGQQQYARLLQRQSGDDGHPGRVFYEWRLLLFRRFFDRPVPVAVLTVGFSQRPSNDAVSQEIAMRCLGSQIVARYGATAGWPAGAILAEDAMLMQCLHEESDLVSYLSDVKKGIDNLLEITLYNHNGMALLSDLQADAHFQFGDRFVEPADLAGQASVLVRREGIGSRFDEESGEEVRPAGDQEAYAVYVPVFHNGGLRGTIEFKILGDTQMVSEFGQAIRQVRLQIIAVTAGLTAAMILASVYFVFRLHRRVARPLESIARAAHELVQGQYLDPACLAKARGLAAGNHYTVESRDLSSAYAHMVDEVQRALKEKDAAYTQLQSVQQHLLNSQREELLSVVSGGVAHEVKNALNPVKLRAERMLMAHRSHLDVGLEEGLTLIIQSVVRCAEISNRLSTFARPAEKESFYPLDLNDVVRDAWMITHDVLQAAKIEVGVQLAEKPVLPGNAKELQQAVMNFLLNSKDAILEARQKGQPAAGRIQVTTAARGSAVELTIADDGCGMTEETQKQVFVPFFTTKEPGKGTGLGMSVSKKILQAHNAEIRLSSEPGKGTTITVLFRPSSSESPGQGAQA